MTKLGLQASIVARWMHLLDRIHDCIKKKWKAKNESNFFVLFCTCLYLFVLAKSSNRESLRDRHFWAGNFIPAKPFFIPNLRVDLTFDLVAAAACSSMSRRTSAASSSSAAIAIFFWSADCMSTTASVDPENVATNAQSGTIDHSDAGEDN
eukprot:SAG31_NODE_3203_length_4559_cov_9.547660_2_plen_151_part_00